MGVDGVARYPGPSDTQPDDVDEHARFNGGGGWK